MAYEDRKTLMMFGSTRGCMGGMAYEYRKPLPFKPLRGGAGRVRADIRLRVNDLSAAKT